MASVSALIDRGIARLAGSIMVRQGALVFAATMILNLGGFAFHAVASRRIGVADYGILYALISMSTILAVPANLAAPVIARFAAEFRVLHDDRHVRRLVIDIVRFFGILGLVYLIVSAFVMRAAGSFLHAPIWPAPLVALIGGTLLLSLVLRAIAQGTQDYAGFARSCVADGISKVVGVLLFTTLGLSLFGGILGFFCGALGGAVAMAMTLSARYRAIDDRTIRYDWRRIALSGVGSAAITLAGALIGSADVILVKHFFDAEQAGIYAAASLAGKVLLYFVGFVPTILLPQATERHVRGERTRYALAMCVGTLFTISLVGLVALKFFGIVLLHALVGHAFDPAAPLLLPYSVAMMFLALSSVLGAYGIATHRIAFAGPLLVGVVGTLLAVVYFHASLDQVVHVVAVGNAITAVAVAGVLAWQALSKRQAPSLSSS
ncbi:MAG: oligosaccharide flippase family protein [Candidatus Eremiobacteraeota bacterium]|nr:oligosaccharide flippase family protein [Candidatus Eremiobacteraeota bacterium]